MPLQSGQTGAARSGSATRTTSRTTDGSSPASAPTAPPLATRVESGLVVKRQAAALLDELENIALRLSEATLRDAASRLGALASVSRRQESGGTENFFACSAQEVHGHNAWLPWSCLLTGRCALCWTVGRYGCSSSNRPASAFCYCSPLCVCALRYARWRTLVLMPAECCWCGRRRRGAPFALAFASAVSSP